MKKFFLLVPVLVFADINPFNVSISPQDYNNLTPQEKQILQNKIDIKNIRKSLKDIFKNLKAINLKLISYDDAIENLTQKTDALNTIISEIDSLKAVSIKLSNENNKTKIEIQKINQKIKLLENNVTLINDEIQTLKKTLKEMANIQNQNFYYLKNSIDTILNTLKNRNRHLSVKEAMKKGKALFFANKLNKAKEYFLYTLSKNYLPATSSFYLGEIAYKQGKYQEALGYYKKSIELYPKKTSFTTRLLYHSGISFEKIGNMEAAKLTFKKIIKDYPDSKFVSLAKKELSKIK